MNASLRSERCDQCAKQEFFGLSKCTWCGTPLAPARSAVENTLRMYLAIREVSGINPRVYPYAVHREGKLYSAKEGHAKLDVFVGTDWLALDATPRLIRRAGLRERPRTSDGLSVVATLDDLVDRWLEELAWWGSQPQQLKTTIDEAHRPNRMYAHRWGQFLASYNETTRSLSIRCFEPGDWCGCVRV